MSSNSRATNCFAIIFICRLLIEFASGQSQTAIRIEPGGSVRVQVGTPPQQFSLLLDVGSGSTWLKSMNSMYIRIGDARAFNETESSSYRADGRRWQIEYASGLRAKGVLASDTFELGGSQAANQLFGICQTTEGYSLTYFGHDGALGLGSRLRPTVGSLDLVQNLFRQGKIGQELFSIHLQTESPATEGTLVLGAIDEQYYTGEVTYIPIESRWSFFVDRVYVKHDHESWLISTWREAVLDTTSNIIQIPEDEYGRFLRRSLANSARIFDPSTNIFPSCEAAENESDLVFEIDGRNFTIPGRHLMVRLQDAEGRENCHSAVLPSDDQYILGQPFLRNFYTIYDYANKRIGLAEAVESGEQD